MAMKSLNCTIWRCAQYLLLWQTTHTHAGAQARSKHGTSITYLGMNMVVVKPIKYSQSVEPL